jgi:hypothetical protein
LILMLIEHTTRKKLIVRESSSLNLEKMEGF